MMLIPKTSYVIQARRLSYKKLRTWYSGLVKAKPSEAPYNHVVQIGDPVLRAPSQEVALHHIQLPEIQYLLEQMRRVFKKFNCVGLSAPQIGVPMRIMMYEFNQNHLNFFPEKERIIKDMHIVPFTIVFNPVMKVTDNNKVTFTESCESVRGFYADVPRYLAVDLKGYDEEAKPKEIKAKGWLARIIQHEYDHLEGRIYTDVMDRKTLACSCWEIVNERSGKVELPYGHT